MQKSHLWSKGLRSNPNPNRPAWVCMSIWLHISLVVCYTILLQCVFLFA